MKYSFFSSELFCPPSALMIAVSASAASSAPLASWVKYVPESEAARSVTSRARERQSHEQEGKSMPQERNGAWEQVPRSCGSGLCSCDVTKEHNTTDPMARGQRFLQSCLRHPDVQLFQEELGIFNLHFPWKCKQRAQGSSAGASSGADAAPRPTAAFPATSRRLGSHVPMQTWWCAVLHGVVVQRRN